MEKDPNYKKDHELEKDGDHPSRKATSSNDPSHHEPGGGITNLPDSEERDNHERLPPRGQAKAGD